VGEGEETDVINWDAVGCAMVATFYTWFLAQAIREIYRHP
jgi:hypothetical protein